MREFSCLTWNIAKRIKYSKEQVNFINSFKLDVVALQEVLINSDRKLKELLFEIIVGTRTVLSLKMCEITDLNFTKDSG